MGNEQPKSIARVSKAQIEIAALKAKIHLELFKDRKNAEVVKDQKELIAKIRSKNRNKTEELLIAQRVVQGLKFASACNLLIAYASNLRLQAQFISENMFNSQKIQPFMVMIYSLIYAADYLGLSSLIEFKTLMRALNNPVALQKYINPQVVSSLSPIPSTQDLNIYMLQFSERNTISLQEINAGGHKFTRQWKNIPSTPKNIPSSFTEIQKMIAEEFKKFGEPGFDDSNQKGGNGGGGFNPYQNLNPKQFINEAQNNNLNLQPPFCNNPSNNFSFGPKITPNNNEFVGGNNGNYPMNTPGNNMGPNIYVPPEITPKTMGQDVKKTIANINEIDYYPQLDANPVAFNKGGYSDPSFDKVCERLKLGL